MRLIKLNAFFRSSCSRSQMSNKSDIVNNEEIYIYIYTHIYCGNVDQ